MTNLSVNFLPYLAIVNSTIPKKETSGSPSISKSEKETASEREPLGISPEMVKYITGKLEGKLLNDEDKTRLICELIWEDLKIIYNSDSSVAVREKGCKTAREVFEQKDEKGNRFADCNEYAYLFVALARAVGLKAYVAHIKSLAGINFDSMGLWRHIGAVVFCKNGNPICVDLANKKIVFGLEGFEPLEDEGAKASFYLDNHAIFSDRGDNKKASAAFEEAQRIASNLNQTNIRLGNNYENFQPEKAEETYKGNIEKNPDEPDAYLRLGLLYYRQDKYDEALQNLEKAVQKGAKDPVAHLIIADIYKRNKQTDKAIEESVEAIILNPENSSFHNYLGDLYYEMGRFKDAEMEYKEGIEIINELRAAGGSAKDINATEKRVKSSTFLSQENIDRILVRAWNHYWEKMVEESGRPKCDPDGGDIDGDKDVNERLTVSEGSSYVMLRAALTGRDEDKERFDKVWEWTKKNLQRCEIKEVYYWNDSKWIEKDSQKWKDLGLDKRADHLFAWRWLPTIKGGEKGGVIYWQWTAEGDTFRDGFDAASDADEDIAASLILAHYRWECDPETRGVKSTYYLEEACKILKDIWDKEVDYPIDPAVIDDFDFASSKPKFKITMDTFTCKGPDPKNRFVRSGVNKNGEPIMKLSGEVAITRELNPSPSSCDEIKLRVRPKIKNGSPNPTITVTINDGAKDGVKDYSRTITFKEFNNWQEIRINIKELDGSLEGKNLKTISIKSQGLDSLELDTLYFAGQGFLSWGTYAGQWKWEDERALGMGEITLRNLPKPKIYDEKMNSYMEVGYDLPSENIGWCKIGSYAGIGKIFEEAKPIDLSGCNLILNGKGLPGSKLTFKDVNENEFSCEIPSAETEDITLPLAGKTEVTPQYFIGPDGKIDLTKMKYMVFSPQGGSIVAGGVTLAQIANFLSGGQSFKDAIDFSGYEDLAFSIASIPKDSKAMVVLIDAQGMESIKTLDSNCTKVSLRQLKEQSQSKNLDLSAVRFLAIQPYQRGIDLSNCEGLAFLIKGDKKQNVRLRIKDIYDFKEVLRSGAGLAYVPFCKEMDINDMWRAEQINFKNIPLKDLDPKKINYIAFEPLEKKGSFDIDSLCLYGTEMKPKNYLLAGDLFFQENGLNPSYFRPAYYERLFPAAEDEMEKTSPKEYKAHPWGDLISTSYEIIHDSARATLHDLSNNAVKGTINYPPNSCSKKLLGKVTDLSWRDDDFMVGWDAFRTLFWVGLHYAWYGDARAHNFLAGEEGPKKFLTEEFNKKGRLLAGYKTNGEPTNWEEGWPEGWKGYCDSLKSEQPCVDGGAYLPFFHFGGNNTIAQSLLERLIKTEKENGFYNPAGYWGDKEYDYYGQNWIWFGLALVNGRFLNPLDGEKTKPWPKDEIPKVEKGAMAYLDEIKTGWAEFNGCEKRKEGDKIELKAEDKSDPGCAFEFRNSDIKGKKYLKFDYKGESSEGGRVVVLLIKGPWPGEEKLKEIPLSPDKNEFQAIEIDISDPNINEKLNKINFMLATPKDKTGTDMKGSFQLEIKNARFE